MQDWLHRTLSYWAALLVGAIGSLGGIAVSSWFLVASSDGGGESMVDLTKVELDVYFIALLVLFCAALSATVLSIKTPRVPGLALIVCAGLGLILAVYGTLVWLLGGLLLLPFGLLAMVAGVMLITGAEMEN